MDLRTLLELLGATGFGSYFLWSMGRMFVLAARVLARDKLIAVQHKLIGAHAEKGDLMAAHVKTLQEQFTVSQIRTRSVISDMRKRVIAMEAGRAS